MNKLLFYGITIFLLITSSRSESTSAKNISSTSMNWDVLMKGRGLDFARTLSSVKSVFTSPLTALAYLGSLAVGAVAMLAFYESPLSPLRVPALPDPPVGRFPPEYPIWPPTSNSGPKSSASEPQGAVRPQGTNYRMFNRRTSIESANPSEAGMNPFSIYHYQVSSSSHSSPKQPTFKSDQESALNFDIQSINQFNSTISDDLSSRNVTDKPQKLFDILMPRTSDNVNLN